jgi:hypothetical protein
MLEGISTTFDKSSPGAGRRVKVKLRRIFALGVSTALIMLSKPYPFSTGG